MGTKGMPDTRPTRQNVPGWETGGSRKWSSGFELPIAHLQTCPHLTLGADPHPGVGTDAISSINTLSLSASPTDCQISHI